MSKWICADASYILRLLLGGTESELAAEYWRNWINQGYTITAPTLLYYEITNVLFRYHQLGQLDLQDTQQLHAAALELPIVLQGDADLHRAAITIAAEFNLSASYDAHYLAIAQRLKCELWTADRKLVNQVSSRFVELKLFEA
ncbi:MAG: type II toxin-antitoxin system VapC family toxin [Deltaproteobacteria bacterium]|nr:type II toxin-antitoxin system VapC family toxin [Deltaproteobacteria bacterium]